MWKLQRIRVLCWGLLLLPFFSLGCPGVEPEELCRESCKGVCIQKNGSEEFQCVACVADKDCKQSDKKVCVSHQCKECNKNDDCKTGEKTVCVANVCQKPKPPPQKGCQSHSDCKEMDKPLCLEGNCVACNPGQLMGCEDKRFCGLGQKTCNETGSWGACEKGLVCKDDEFCNSGSCQPKPACKQGEVICAENCVDPQTNNDHCGSCGHSCKAYETCLQGKCVAPECRKNADCKTGESCVAQKCTSCPAASCKLGQRRCKGDGVERCEFVDGCPSWKKADSCKAPTSCQKGLCVEVCKADADCSQEQVCTKGVCQTPPWAMIQKARKHSWFLDSHATSDRKHLIAGVIDLTGEMEWEMTSGKVQKHTRSASHPTSYLGLQREDGKFEWILSLPSDDVALKATAITPLDGLCVLGTLRKDTTLKSAGGTLNVVRSGKFFDILVMKVDSKGAILWAKAFGGEKSDVPHSIAARPDGGCVLVGVYGDPSITIPTKKGNVTLKPHFMGSAPLFVSLDKDGEVDWAGSSNRKDIGTKNLGVTVSPNGDATFVLPGLTFLRYDATGKELWSYRTKHHYQGSSQATYYFPTGSPLSLISDSKGDLYIGALTTNGRVARPLLTKAGMVSFKLSSFVLMKLSSKGEMLWGSVLESNGNASLQLKLDSQERLYALGAFATHLQVTMASGVKRLERGKLQQGFLLRFVSNGRVEWIRFFGPAQTAKQLSLRTRGFSISSMGDIYVTGDFRYGPMSVGKSTLVAPADPFMKDPITSFLFKTNVDGLLP